jgi:hypothetical protein
VAAAVVVLVARPADRSCGHDDFANNSMTNGEIDLAVVHRVAQDDADWFGANPTERFRYRAYVDGETDLIWLDVPELPDTVRLTLLVEVERLSAHARRRTFCWAVRVAAGADANFMSTVDEDDDIVELGRSEAVLGAPHEDDDSGAIDPEDDVVWEFARRRALEYLRREGIGVDGGVETGLLHAIADGFGPIAEALAFYGDPATYDDVVVSESPLAADTAADHGDPVYNRPMPGALARAAVQHLFEDDATVVR